MDTLIANSRPTMALVRELGIGAQKLEIVHPGVELPQAPQAPDALLSFRQRHGLGNARLLLSVGRLTTRKGLLEFVQHALPTIVRSAPDTLLVVVGDAPANALHASVQSRESIQAAADAAGIGEHLRFLGLVTDAELACAYESATLHVFPVRHISGDPEGFGMVAVEAAARGLPTVAFAVGGVVDAVASGQSGQLIAPGDYDKLVGAVLHILSDRGMDWQSEATAFARQFAWPAFGENLRSALQHPVQ